MNRSAPLCWVLALVSVACTSAPAAAPQATATGPTGVLTSPTSQPRLNVGREAFDRTYQRTVVDTKMWSTDGLTKVPAVQGVVDSVVELGTLTPPAPDASKYVDNSYAELGLRTRQEPRN